MRSTPDEIVGAFLGVLTEPKMKITLSDYQAHIVTDATR